MPADTQRLWINPPADGFWQPLAARSALVFHHGDAQHMAGHLEVSSDLAPANADHIVLYLPKSKARLQLLVDLAVASLSENGQLWLVGAKKAGIASAGKLLAQHFTSSRKVDAARHCMLFEAAGVKPGPSFNVDKYWQQYSAEKLQLFSLPGVFSHGRLDLASAMLIKALPEHMPGRCLDFGAGCGVLSATAAQRGAEVTAIDVDLLAVRSCQRTLAENQLAGNVISASAIDQQAGPYRWIISNPPFHKGVTQDLTATYQMLDDAAAALSQDGELWLVANRFLNYTQRLKATFREIDEMAGSGAFRVIRARAKK